MLDADGMEIRVGDSVRVLFNAGSLAEGESPVERRALALAEGGPVDLAILEWWHGEQAWPADACRKAPGK